MTGEEFHSKYRLGEGLTKPPVVTHQATDASGSPVLVHFLVGDETARGASFLEAVSQLGPAETAQIREVIDIDGRPAVVTDVLAGFSTFPEWLNRVIPSRTAQAEPGAYTKLFKVPSTGLENGSTEPSPPPETSAPSVVQPPGPESPASPGFPASPAAPVPTEAPVFPGAPTSAPAPEDLEKDAGSGPPVAPTPPPVDNESEGTPPGSYTQLFAAVGGNGEENQNDPPASATQEIPGSLPSASPSVTPPPESGPIPPASEAPAPSIPPPPVSVPPETLSDDADIPKPVFPTPGPLAPPAGAPPAGAPPAGAPPAGAPPAGAPPAGAPPLPPPEPLVPEPPLPVQEEHPTAAPEPPPQASEPEGGKSEDGKPGAYTQIFGRPSQGGASSATPGISGDFGVPSPPVQPPASPPVRPQAPPHQVSPSDPSSPDWQRWRDTPGAAGRHIPSDDYLQRLGASPDGRSGGPGPSNRPGGDPEMGSPPGEFPGANETPSGPGHYTTIRKGLPQDPGPAAQMAPPFPSQPSREEAPKPAARPSRRSSVFTVIGLVAVFLAIVAVVVAFALWA